MLRIFERTEGATKVLSETSELINYLDFLISTSSKKLVIGSAWPSDLAILNDHNWSEDLKSGRIHMLIVPHSLRSQSIGELKRDLNHLFPEIPLYEISRGKGLESSDLLRNKPGLVLLNIGGVLCELYTKFSFAYVGGGYERSIHSVLEPFLSGAKVSCGPLIQRSTEFDFIKDVAASEIHLLNNPESFYNLFNAEVNVAPNSAIRTALKQNAGNELTEIINEIENG